MARIRTIKPEFFRHEKLQDLETEHPGQCCMLVFAGLWGHCDKLGRFEWRPRTLKLDILPFLSFDLSETLDILHGSGLLNRYAIDGKEYGEIKSFQGHQRIGGKEAQELAKHPGPTSESLVKHRGSNREALGIAGREGNRKGREGNGKGREVCVERFPSASPVLPEEECAEPLRASPPTELFSEPPVIEIPILGGSSYPVTQSEIDEWSTAYPAVDVLQVLRNLRQWNLSNPTKQKTPRGVRKHITGALARDQDRGGRGASARGGGSVFEHNVRVMKNFIEGAQS